MTVIASYNHFGCGIVIGDILITGDLIGDNLPQINLPSVGDVTTLFGDSWGIKKPSQKVCIISDNCAIAWAGSWVHARIFIGRLARLSRRITISKRIIELLFRKIEEKQIGIVGAIYENGIMNTFGYDCEHLNSSTLGDVFSCGSGASIVKDYLEIVQIMNLTEPAPDEIASRGVSLALTQISHLLNTEFRNGENSESFREAFGGGYEIAAFYNEKFHKINCNFIFHNITLADGFINVGNPKLIITQTYDNGHLLFQSISTEEFYDDEISRNEVIEIPLFHRNINDHPAASPSSNLNWTSVVFVDDFLFLGNQLVSTVIKSETASISYSTADGILAFSYSDQASEHICKFLFDNYQKYFKSQSN